MKSIISLNSFTPAYYYTKSVSLVMIKSYILDKLASQGQDRNLDIKINSFFCEDSPDEAVRTICSTPPLVIGFSVYPWNVEIIKKISAGIKQRLETSLIVLGGPPVTFEAAKVLKEWKGADVIIKGPGEETFFQLLIAWLDQKDISNTPNLVYRKGEDIVETPYKRNFFIQKQYYRLHTEEFEGFKHVNYDTSKGCIYKCNFCAWNADGTQPRGFRYYPMTKVKEDLKNIFALESLEKFSINDSDIPLNEARCIEIFRHINMLNQKRREKEKPYVKIYLESNPESFTDNTINELKKLNVGFLQFGLQSIDPEVLRIANRKFNKEKYATNIQKLSEKGRSQVFIELIFGMPGDTLDKFRNTLEFVLTELRTYSFFCFRFLLLPGSPFWYQKEPFGIQHKRNYPYEVISTNTFSMDELNYADMLASWFEMFFSTFRSIKKTIERRTLEHGMALMPIYEKLFKHLSTDYEDFFDKGYKQEHTHYYVLKLQERENSEVRRSIASKSRKILREIF